LEAVMGSDAERGEERTGEREEQGDDGKEKGWAVVSWEKERGMNEGETELA
jgi:hypothetical protein